ncbi:sialidase family protein [Methylosarcina fibrata]|uniref:sialidase family protein n=1 Tax=Methylosarcina fibrata TaxID=105972 RepID=UPI00037FB632|nr:sialidase family protein [Methylosarcina fibrata]
MTVFIVLTRFFPAVLFIGFCSSAAAAGGQPAFPVQELDVPAAEGSKQHHLSQTADGRLILSWVESDGPSSTVRFAVREGPAWSPVRTVSRVDGKLGDPPVVFGLDDGSLAAAWMPYVKGGKSQYAADIYLARSQDGGLSWSPAFKPYAKKARIYDAQMSLTPLPDARIALVWTDMRDADGHKKKDRYRLMATVLAKNQQRAGKETTLDGDVCSCCRVYTAARGEDLLTVYRDHAQGEIRDTAAVRWRPGGKAQAASVPGEGWHIEGCPSNGPAVDVSGPATAAAWFSAADGKGRVRVAFSKDGGKRFAKPVEVDDNANGYVNVSLLNQDAALVSWRGRAGPEDELRIAMVEAGGISRQTVIYRGDFPKWPSKYPGMVRLGQQAFVAWTDPAKNRVRLAAVMLDY